MTLNDYPESMKVSNNPCFAGVPPKPVKRLIYITQEMNEQLKRTAALERRSINSQVRVLLEEGLRQLYEFEVKQ